MKKNKGYIILIIVILLAIIAPVVFLRLSVKKWPTIKPIEVIKTPAPVLPADIGYGWSVADNTKSAIREAVAMAKKQLKGEKAKLVILFSTVDYNQKIIIQKILDSFGPETQIYGGTSCQAVINQDGYHASKSGALALLTINSPKIDIGVGGADLDNFNSAQEAGKTAITRAIAKAGKNFGEKPSIVLITAAPGKEEKILLGIEEVIGKDVPIIGGSSADNDITGKWKQFANQEIFSNGVSLAAIYTDFKVGMAYTAGFEKSEKTGVITKAEDRTIYEIDHQPAAEVYNRWTGGLLAKELEHGGNILAKASFFPLAQMLRNPISPHHPYFISVHPLAVEASDKSLTVFADVVQGKKITLLHGSWQILINRAQNAAADALESQDIDPDKILFGLYTYCGGTLLVIPEKERAKIPALINNELQGQPFIGTFTFGEQGFFAGVGSRHGNLANSMIIFAEK